MPLLPWERLHRLAFEILQAAGASQEEAQTVADHMVGANLAGHDSHGVLLLPMYVASIKNGHAVPGAPFEIVRETPTTLVINGHWGFGQIVSTRAMQQVIDKAQEQGLAAATVYYQSHVGRLADYPLMAARVGMIGVMMADSGRTAKAVAPFGGKDRRLGTNPLCIALPSDLTGPVFLDMATSQAAAGKLSVYRNRQQPVPAGWLLDREGNPTTDPAAFFQGGALLPLGGMQGYKGYGLSFMVEVFSGILTGLGFGHDPTGPHNDGCFMLAMQVGAFFPLDEFKRQVEAFVRYLKDSPPASGSTEVLYPGELEYRTEQQRRQEGIVVEEQTWEALQRVAQEYRITVTPHS